MNARGQYGNGHAPVLGADLLHTLELRQRYENVSTMAAGSLLRDLSSDGSLSSTGANRWQVALRGEGIWILIAWYPDAKILDVTITDRELRSVDQMASVRRRYETILASKITLRLQTYGAAIVGGEIYAKPDIVGITVYHSVGDRADAVKQMAVDWNALYQNLASQVGELTPDPTSPSGYHITTQIEWDANPPDPKKVTWWKSYAHPLIKQWVKFKSNQLGGDRTVAADYIAFAERWQTNWDVYEDWKKKLDALRAEAQKRGFVVDAPKPTELPTTVWADVAETVKEGAGKVAGGIGDIWSLAKYGLWAALGIGALVAVSSVASNIKRGKDPAEKYTELIRTRRQPREPRVQAAPTRLALPPGEPAEDA